LIRLLLCLVVAWLAGCASTRTPAPVREARPVGGKPSPIRAQSPPAAGHYRVQAGDTLYKIAFEYGLDYRDLAVWNRLADPGRIRADDVLRITPPIPAPRLGVTTAALPAEPSVAVRAITVEPAPLPDQPEDPPESWIWPSRGALLARFGEGNGKGIDIGGPRGQPVRAAAPGRVVYAGTGLRGYGKLIIIRHGKTLLSAYAHNARILVDEGQTVARGQAIAEMGDSDTDRVKLHFEIREYGKPVDPLNYLPRMS
jgi:lipoprotein NlpD